MQSLNDDMDELFRRAGEEYPLNTNSADWNKVMQQLHHTEEDLPEVTKKKKDYRYLLLLLLLPIGFMIGRYIGNENRSAVPKANKEVKTISTVRGNVQPTTSHDGPAITGIRAKDDGGKEQGIKDSESKDVLNSKSKPNSSSANIRGGYNGGLGSSKIVNKQGIVTTKIGASPKAATRDGGGENVKDHSLAGSPALKQVQDLKDADNVTATKTPSAVTGNPSSDSKPLLLQKETTAEAAINKKIDSKSGEAVTTVETRKSNISKQKPFKSKLSYSLLIGPDLSLVKFQRTSEVGYSFGIMLGYQLTDKLAVEAGVLWDRKNYYTKGKYLDTSRLKLPMHSTILSADGYCNMIEIPVNIRYNFITKKDHSWFISAGLSSYLMKQEKYDLNYQRYNQPYADYYGYKNSSKDWFSIMNVSAGYQTPLGKAANIRIAPYVKLPLRGVGIGKLPISSTGIYFTISRPAH